MGISLAVAGLTAALAPAVAGAAAVLCAPRRRGARFYSPVLFHSVCTERRAHFSYVKKETFEQFCQRLRSTGIPAVTAAVLVNAPTAPSTSACLCFDDGFEDFYRNALPALQACGLTCTVFPVTSFIGRAGHGDAFGPRPRMSAAQLREIAALGHCVGSHTHTHPDLRYLPDPLVDEELKRSKAVIEDVTSSACTVISFPYGSCSRRLWQRAVDAGYTAGIVYGAAHSPAPGLYAAAGVYAFDTVDDIMEKAAGTRRRCHAIARASVMPRFAQGTALWKFRKEYRLP